MWWSDEVCLMTAKKKVGQRISHHLLRGGEEKQPGGIKKKGGERGNMGKVMREEDRK